MTATLVKITDDGEEVIKEKEVDDLVDAYYMLADYILDSSDAHTWLKDKYGNDDWTKRGQRKREEIQDEIVYSLERYGKAGEDMRNYEIQVRVNDGLDERYTESDDYDEDAWEMADDLLANFLEEKMNKTNALVGLEFDPYREVLKMTYDKKHVYVASEYGYDGGYWANAEEGDLEQDLKNIQRYLSENGIELIVDGKDIQLAFSEALKEEHERNDDEPWMNPTFDIRCKVQLKEKYLTESGNNVAMRLKGFVSAWDSKNKPGMVDIVCKCPWCKRTNVITMNKNEWYDGVLAVNDGELIQNAFPTLGDDEREMLKTGICDQCWKSLGD